MARNIVSIGQRPRVAAHFRRVFAMDYTLPEFLAHALALEHEAAERYRELAELMSAHGNREVWALFRDMVHFSTLHHDDIQRRVGDIELPRLQRSDYRWTSPPEAGLEASYEQLSDPFRALQYARENEVRAMEYYSSVGQSATDPDVRRLAAEFAGEEADHVDALDDWLAHLRNPPLAWAVSR